MHVLITSFGDRRVWVNLWLHHHCFCSLLILAVNLKKIRSLICIRLNRVNSCL